VNGVIVAEIWSNNMIKDATDRQGDMSGTIRCFSGTPKRK
jgi:hypothetical protein